MTIQRLIIELPEPLFERLKRMAELSHRPVAEYITQSLDIAVIPDAPPQVQAELAQMIYLNDQALWDVTQPQLSSAEDSRLRQLNHTAGEQELTMAQQQELDGLLERYHLSVLRRARAFAILQMRGFVIPTDQKLPLAVERA